MVLQLCAGCRRHVDVREHACPFCGDAVVAMVPRSIRGGRWSRAMVFAGAAVLGCDQGTPPAKPAPPVEKAPAVAPKPARLHGVVVMEGTPRRGANVIIGLNDAGSADRPIYAVTDEQGRFDQPNLAPGTYRLFVEWAPVTGEGGQRALVITLGAGADEAVTVELERVAPMIEAKPYGAPPARRRVV